MPGLRVFKHALRGMSYRQMGQTKLALISLDRALQLDPKNTLARQQLWGLHRALDFAELKNHPELIPFLNFDFCLERISQALATKPSPDELRDTYHMLDLIDVEQPELRPISAYWRAVAYLHEHRHGAAAEYLTSILKLPQDDTPQRQAVHFSSWLLALYGHPEMNRQVAQVLLPQPGQRMDAIAAVERQLAQTPEDAAAWDMKRQLYSELTEAEYWTLVQPGQIPALFSHEYTQQLGLALLDNPEGWQRGCAYLRIAANGLPLQTAGFYIQIAQTHEKHGDLTGMWANYQKAMQLGRAVGVEQLPAADKEALFATVKKIGETAFAQNEIETALAAYKFYAEHGTPGIETYRILAELFERKKDVWMALYSTEFGFAYNSADKDLIARKDRYYYSITPDELKERMESVRKWFDPQYCRDKARWILENWGNDFDNLDWASHLLELANVAQPGSHANRFLKARIHRLRGEIPEAIAVLEEVRQHRPEKFVNEDEEKAWYFAHRMLGDLYLDEKPAEAEACYLEFRQSDESGADTSYKLGKAFEAQGKLREAIRCYEEVTAYERHPLYYEARDALDRVKRGAASSRPA
jgi:tetratricopeptide (TPR) repeat protein